MARILQLLILGMMVFKNVKNARVSGSNEMPKGWNTKC